MSITVNPAGHTEDSVLPQAYTVEQVAVILQCHPKTVRKLCTEDRLRSVMIGDRHRRIPRDALNEFLQSKR